MALSVRATRLLLCVTLSAAALTACTDDGAIRSGAATFTPLERDVDVAEARTPAGLALEAARRFYASSEVAVLAPAEAGEAQQLATRAGAALRAPVLLESRAVDEELDRLGAEVVLSVGATSDVARSRQVEPTEEAVDAAVEDVGRTHDVPEEQENDAVVLVRDAAGSRAAVTTARNAGADVVEVPSSDPRATPEAVDVLAARPQAPVVGLGRSFRHGLRYQVDSIREDRQQLGGGLLVFPGRHLVALYGHHRSPSLGLLGEQGPRASVQRAERLAARYDRIADDPVVPAFELIVTVASSEPGRDKDFSAETDVADVEPLVRAAEEAGMYVVLDLQPGRTDFLTQAKRYRSLLERPHVGLALDPEWRLGRGQRHLRQIGSVSAGEVNRVSAWLAELTRDAGLPQKLFVLHQFSRPMIRDRGDLVTTHPELTTVIHVDGQGTPGAKRDTWGTIRRGAPEGIAWGWKNFIDEDEPMLDPRATWRIDPTPDLVTYQ
ncbi:hypothetical protein ACHAAC_04360 [Aeromicrobium sp. CF4.19]|uniref:hypothetical protein n=1 Tax=Aeromicrobium sp. CF4.19 TaxID=3373082 RepID=UPI003EE4F2B3